MLKVNFLAHDLTDLRAIRPGASEPKDVNAVKIHKVVPTPTDKNKIFPFLTEGAFKIWSQSQDPLGVECNKMQNATAKT